MAGQGQRQIIFVNAAAVIAHLDQLGAALLDLDLDSAAAGIQAVFQ